LIDSGGWLWSDRRVSGSSPSSIDGLSVERLRALVVEQAATIAGQAATIAEQAATIAEHEATIVEQVSTIAVLSASVATLTARVEELSRRLGLNSRNSSKPPSSDGLAKPPPRSLRKRRGRRPGGQPGSDGHALRQVADPDERHKHYPRRCGGCGAGLAWALMGWVAARRQVFELPEVRVRVIEHQLFACRCGGCGAVTRAADPPGVAAPVQYGPGVAAVVVYLLVRQHLPVARVAEVCAELLGTPVSTGWIAGQLGPAGQRLTGFDAHARQVLRRSPVVHFDESGARTDGRIRWVHSASTSTLTVYDLHDKRGRQAMDTAGILPGFTGIAVHDCWQPYFTFTHLDHAVCNAHILRELAGWHDTDPHRHRWAKQAADLLREAHTAVVAARAAGRTSLPRRVLTGYPRRWKQIITAGQAANPRPTSGRDPVGALLNRLRAVATEIWRFAHDFRVPFDNNQAERDIRMVKLQIKISGCWRTTTSAHDWLRVRSYISTLTKNGLAVLQGIRDALTGNPWLPPLPEPT
jgi:transposase